MSISKEVTVLVADDDADMRALVAFTLRRAGFAVVTAHGRSNALERLDSARHRSQAAVDLDPPTWDPVLPV